MKIHILFGFISLSLNLLAHDRLTFLENEKHLQICVVKQKGDSICGTSNLNRLLNSGKLILARDNNEKVKLFNADIKYILLDSIRLQSLVIEDDDIYSEYLIREIDTIGKIKLFEGYTTVNKSHGSGMYPNHTMGFSSTDIYFSYILKIGKKQIHVINEYKLIIFNIDVSNNNKKKLKKIFSKYPKVVQYIETVKQLEFDDIPKVIKHINSIL